MLLAATFENGMGGFTQSADDTVDFFLKSGSTDSQPTGPRVDHTFGNETGNVIMQWLTKSDTNYYLL